MRNELEETKNVHLFSKVAELIELARKKVATTVNLTMVHTYFEIGRMIIEDEQEGKERAKYGKSVLKDLSSRLTEKFGRGFSVENLDRMRFFYKTYSGAISSTPLTNLKNDNNQLLSTKSFKFSLSWSHYLVLMRIENPAERKFYEIEAVQQNWSESQLKRQYHSIYN